MPTATRTFRVFVSSTFEDLKAERDALQREVFPRLRKLCEGNNARFQAIDLRWGVRDEAALDQQTMEICLREIERCQQTGIKPNFIVLLGERYGWRPLPARIEAGEFEKVCYQVTDADKWLIDDWYERDDNAVPPEFLLKPRTGEFVDKDRWGEVEQQLHSILREAAREAGLAPESLIKYEASATHQEILKGLGQSEEDRQHVFAFCRAVPDEKCDPELANLRRSLKGQLPAGNFLGYEPDDLARLCKQVEEALSAVITNEAAGFKSKPALDLEIEAHDRFAADRCRIFVGRKNALDAIEAYIRGPERRPLVLHGASGSGKSAVMAKASEQYTGPGRVIRRFIGASPESTSGHALLTSLCKQIVPGDTPVDYAQLVKAFQERLANATEEQPLVLFVDALDQLSASDPARAAIWLPAELQPHVKVIVSTTDEGAQLPAGLLVPLERMTTAEGGQALDELLQGTDPREQRRALQPWQRNRVLEHFERCGLPLYLKLAAEESRLWKSFSPPETCALGEGIAGILDTLFDRLASNANHGPVLVERSLSYLAAARYGLTEDEMLDVLTADDAVWQEFLTRAHHTPPEHRLPVIVWSRLFLDLEPYLSERSAPGGTVVSFYHRQLADRVAARFLSSDDICRLRHCHIADFFTRRARGNAAASEWETSDVHAFAECIFHLVRSGRCEIAAELLSDFPFLMGKVRVGLLDDVFDDYRILEGLAPSGLDSLTHAWSTFLLSTAHVLHRADPSWPAHRILLQLAVEYGEDSVVTAGAERWIASGRCDWLWYRSVNRRAIAQKDPWDEVLEGHSGSMIGGALELSEGGIVSWAPDQTLRLWQNQPYRETCVLRGRVKGAMQLSDGRVVSWGRESPLVWDSRTGSVLLSLKGHRTDVLGIRELRDERLISWAEEERIDCGSGWKYDNTIRIWESHSGACILVLKGHELEVKGVIELFGGKLVSWEREEGDGRLSDNLLRVWDSGDGSCVATFQGHQSEVRGVLEISDGRLLSWSLDPPLLWNIESGSNEVILEEQTNQIDGAIEIPDHKLICWGGYAAWVWDFASSTCVAELEELTAPIDKSILLSDGRLAYWGGRSARVWDPRGDSGNACIRVEEDSIDDILQLHDGRIVLRLFGGALLLWDGSGGNYRPIIGSAGLELFGMLELHNGRLLTWDRKTLRIWNLDDLEMSGVGPTVVEPSTIPGLSRDPCLFRIGSEEVICLHGDTLWRWGRDPRCNSTVNMSYTLAAGKVLRLESGHLLSWFEGKTARLLDYNTGSCLATFEGHTAPIEGVIELPGGVLFSWSDWKIEWNRSSQVRGDSHARFWDAETGDLIEAIDVSDMLTKILGVLSLPGGRFAIWTEDQVEVRDVRTREPIASIGSMDWKEYIGGAIALSNGRLLYWSNKGFSSDPTLRVLDTYCKCLTRFDGHSSRIEGAREFPDGRILSWSAKEMVVWDSGTGMTIETVESDRAALLRPELWHARISQDHPSRSAQDWHLEQLAFAVKLQHARTIAPVSMWHAQSTIRDLLLRPDGFAFVAFENGRVDVLKLCRGDLRVSLAQAEPITGPSC